VVLACRDLAAATQVCEEVIKATGNEKIHALHLDLSDFSSIDQFVEQLANCKNFFVHKSQCMNSYYFKMRTAFTLW
jgi:hypothetical protein